MWCTPYRKLTFAEAFGVATIPNAFGSSLQAGAARRISARFAEAAALPCINRMCRRVWESKSGRVAWELKFDTERGLFGALGGPWGASWGLSFLKNRFWGVFGVLWGFLGAYCCLGFVLGVFGGSRELKKSFGNSGCQPEVVLAPKEPPGPPENAPTRAQEAPKSTFRSIFKCKTSLHQTC